MVQADARRLWLNCPFVERCSSPTPVDPSYTAPLPSTVGTAPLPSTVEAVAREKQAQNAVCTGPARGDKKAGVTQWRIC